MYKQIGWSLFTAEKPAFSRVLLPFRRKKRLEAADEALVAVQEMLARASGGLSLQRNA